jgi:hypothetical protein
MRHYRQHPIVLISALIECLVLGGFGLGLTLLYGYPLFLALLALAFVIASWRTLQWATFSLRVEGRQVTLRNLHGFVVTERVVSLSGGGGLRLRQNVSGYFLDYGQLRIDVFGEPVQVRYLTPFSSLKRQIDGA